MTDRITYRCPACNHQTLIVDSIGHFVCSWLECKNPCAFSDMIDQRLAGTADPVASPTPNLRGLAVSLVSALQEDGYATFGAEQEAEFTKRIFNALVDACPPVSEAHSTPIGTDVCICNHWRKHHGPKGCEVVFGSHRCDCEIFKAPVSEAG